MTRACLARIDALNPRLNAYCLVDAAGALRAAQESEARWMGGAPKGLLDGVPVSIKDLILTSGWPTLRGSRTVDANQPWDQDAPATARLREHGAVILGKTTTPEFGWKAVTDGPLTGITRNPWNPAKTPGGSSGGAAAALAAGMGALAVGTDGGRIDPDPGRFHGRIRPEAELRPRPRVAVEPVRHGLPRRPHDAHGGRCCADAERRQQARCAGLVCASLRGS